jgi:SHS2 domain-containing protein
MAGTYQFVEQGAQADVTFTAEADSLPTLLEVCAEATFAVMTEPREIKPRDRHNVTVHANTLEDLLFLWLEDLVFIKDNEEFLAGRFRVRCPETPPFHLQALVEGEKIDRRRHVLKVDVKAPTYHEMDIRKDGDRWYARVVLDV